MARRSPTSTRFCSRCGSLLQPDSQFCHSCGDHRTASQCVCGKALPLGANFCPHCGTPVGSNLPSMLREVPSPSLELRPVTVFFVDMIGSTSLAERLGPERFRDVIVRFRTESEPIIEAHGGFVAQHTGDSILAFFGYPEARANSARSGVEAALDIIAHTTASRGDTHVDLFHARIGCHSGPVIAEPSPTTRVAGAPAEGLTIALASRVQAEAPPDAVVVTAQTHQLVEEFFDCKSIGARMLKGVASPVQLFQVIGRRRRGEFYGFPASRKWMSFVNRKHELSTLRKEWDLSDGRRGRSLILTGEAGVGKSRLVSEFCRSLARPGLPCIVANCDEDRKATAFGVFASLLLDDVQERSAGEDGGCAAGRAPLESLLDALGLDRDVAVGLEPLLAPAGATVHGNDPVALMRQIQASLLAYLRALVGKRGLLVVEDIQWCDPSSREILSRLLEDGPPAGVLVILTCRPGEGELDSVLSGVPVFGVEPFSDAHSREIIRSLDTRNDLSDDGISKLIRTCDGNPLYIEECTRALIDERTLDFTSIEAIPDRLQGILWRRLDRLGRLKWLVQVAAVLGQRFDPIVLGRVVTRLADERRRAEDIQQDLEELERAGVVTAVSNKPGGSLSFRHALVREAAYGSLPSSIGRRWHKVVASVSEEAVKEGIADVPTEAIAGHWSAAGRPDKAAPFYLQAGRKAAHRFANAEAMSLFRYALDEIGRIEPDSARAGIELKVRLDMNATVIARVGWASEELESNNLRILTVARADENDAEIFQCHRMLFNVALLRADAANVKAHLEGLRATAPSLRDGSMVLDRCEGAKRMFVDGDVEGAEEALARSLTAFDPDRHRVGANLYDLDGEVAVKSLRSWLLWFGGRPTPARELALETIELAETIRHPFSLAYALCLCGSALLSVGDHDAVEKAAADAQQLARKYYMDYWIAYADVLAAGAMIRKDPAAAAAALERAREGYRATGARLILPWINALEADARQMAGETGRADRLRAETAGATFGLFRLLVNPTVR